MANSELRVTELHEKTGSCLQRVRLGESLTIVDRWGYPLARLVPVRIETTGAV